LNPILSLHALPPVVQWRIEETDDDRQAVKFPKTMLTILTAVPSSWGMPANQPR
jgi:hypothetical protein